METKKQRVNRLQAVIGQKLTLIFLTLTIVFAVLMYFASKLFSGENSRDLLSASKNILEQRSAFMSDVLHSCASRQETADFVINCDSLWATTNLNNLPLTYKFTGVICLNANGETVYYWPNNTDTYNVNDNLESQKVKEGVLAGQRLNFFVSAKEKVYNLVAEGVKSPNGMPVGTLIFFKRWDDKEIEKINSLIGSPIFLSSTASQKSDDTKDKIFVDLKNAAGQPVANVSIVQYSNKTLNKLKKIGILFFVFVGLTYFFIQALLFRRVMWPIKTLISSLDNDQEVEFAHKNLVTKEFFTFGNLVNDNLKSRKDLKAAYEEQHTLQEELRQNNEELHCINENLESAYSQLNKKSVELEQINEELKITTEYLKKQEEYLSTILSNLGEGFLILNADFIITMSNLAAQRLLSVGKNTLANHSIFEFIDTEYRQKIIDETINIKNGESVRYEATTTDIANDKHVFMITASPHQNIQTRAKEYIFIIYDVTDERRNANKIKEQNIRLNKYFTAINQSPDVIVLTDIDGHIEYANPAFEITTGYNLQEVLGQTPRILKSGKTPENTYKELWETIKSGRIWHGEFVNRKKDGGEYYEKAIISPVKDNFGNIISYLAIKEDITENRTTQAKLKETQRNYALIAENSNDVIWIFDVGKQKITYISPSVKTMRGFTPEEAMQMPLEDFFAKESLEHLAMFSNQELIWSKMRDGSLKDDMHFEVKQTLKDGGLIDVDIQLSPYYETDSKGNKLVQVIGTNRNITERKQKDEILRQSEEKYRIILENTADIIIKFNPKTLKVIFITPAITALAGYTPEEVVGMNVLDLFATQSHEKIKDVVMGFLTKRVLLEPGTHYRGTFKFKHKNGKIFDVETMARFLRDENDNFTDCLAVVRDISYMVAYENKLRSNNNLFKTLIDNLPAKIYLKGKNLKYQVVNKQYANTLGFDIKDIIGKTDIELGASYANEYTKLDEEVITKLEPVIDYEKQILDDEDGNYWTSTSKVPYYNEENKLEGIIGIVQDITKRKRNESMMNERTRQFENTIKTLTDVYIKTDLDGVIIQVSPSVCQFYGCQDVTDIIGKIAFDVLQPEVVDEIRNKLLSFGELKAFNFKFTNLKKEERHGEGNFVIWYDDLDMPSGFEGIIRDVTDRIKYEKMLNDMSKELMESLSTVGKQKVAIESTHKNMLESISYAKRIQSSLQPDENNIKDFLNDAFLIYRPCEIVGGDWYCVMRRAGKTIVAVADCTGHGVPGALMSVLAISSLNNVITQMDRNNITASGILEALRYKMINTMNKSLVIKDGLDICLTVIDEHKGVLQYSGANNPLFIVRDGNLIVLNPTKCPVGLHPIKLDFIDEIFEYKHGDSVFYFSDGYQDQFGGPLNRKFTRKALKEFLPTIGGLSTQKQKEALIKNLEDWMAAQNLKRQVDDITVLGIKF